MADRLLLLLRQRICLHLLFKQASQVFDFKRRTCFCKRAQLCRTSGFRPVCGFQEHHLLIRIIFFQNNILGKDKRQQRLIDACFRHVQVLCNVRDELLAVHVCAALGKHLTQHIQDSIFDAKGRSLLNADLQSDFIRRQKIDPAHMLNQDIWIFAHQPRRVLAKRRRCGSCLSRGKPHSHKVCKNILLLGVLFHCGMHAVRKAAGYSLNAHKLPVIVLYHVKRILAERFYNALCQHLAKAFDKSAGQEQYHIVQIAR